MAKKMLIDATHAEETRVVVVDGNKVEEFDFESENKRQLAGNIYLAKVTRVEPSLQAAFVDYGGNRHGFLAFSEIHPDYYQIPVADREALMEEERAYAEAMKARDEEAEEKPKPKRRRSRSKSKAEGVRSDDAVETREVDAEITGMETIDPADGETGLVEDASGATDAADAVTADVADTAAADAAETTETDAAETEAEPEISADAPASEGDAPVADAAADAPEGEAAEVEADADQTDVSEADAPEGEAAEVDADQTDVSEADAPETDEAPAPEMDDADAPEGGEDAAAPESDEASAPETDDAPAPEGEDDASAAEGDEASAPEGDDDSAPEGDDDADDDDGDAPKKSDASDKDDSIESVADEDDSDDIRPPRKPRPRRYKIQEVIKVRQILLVQVVKEERGNKGAALTTYLSLAGRYCVLMPNTARGGGISRKITNAADRKKLKEIASEIDVPTGAGLIIRTAGAKRTKSEIKRDYEYLQRLWEQIRELTLKSIAPAKIYEEGDLIKRTIRDLYNREIDEVLVEGDRGYRIAKDFMKMIMPSHAKNVRHYQDALPLFARYQVETYLGGMFNPTVQLKSGGYIVIGVTEALVAIDVNSGRATKEGSIEETALKTNLEAADEVARQLRLRDLAGLIVIDFIDMDDRKNNAAVEKRMKDRLKTDRARIQVGRISGFGLMEMSRQRLRPGMIEATTQPCPACHGTGLIRSDDNLALTILRQIEEEGTRRKSREVLVKCPVSIANFLMNAKREHIAQIEARYGLSVRIEADPHLVSPDFAIEKFKTASRSVPAATAPVVSVDAMIMDEVDAEAVVEDEAAAEAQTEAEAPAPETTDEEAKPKKRRRRRRRGRGRSSGDKDTEAQAGEGDNAEAGQGGSEGAEQEASDGDVSAAAGDQPAESTEAAASDDATSDDATGTTDAAEDAAPEAEVVVDVTETEDTAEAAPDTQELVFEMAEPVAERAAEAEAEAAPEQDQASEDITEAEPVADTVADTDAPDGAASAPGTEAADVPEETVTEIAPEPVLEPVAEAAEPAEPPKPKRRGWWSRGS
ncbi:MAG: Rne/Rng family ribonuclease [Marinibacterium sp.]|nr:Rne/Rng family ribonuclease [Marinibacterium sp.]